jgi:hypothetical protein
MQLGRLTIIRLLLKVACIVFGLVHTFINKLLVLISDTCDPSLCAAVHKSVLYFVH